MQVVNFDPISVDDSTGELLLTSEQATAAGSAGLEYLGIESDVDIVIVDSSNGDNWANVPGAVAGTAANSPFKCPANTFVSIRHRRGAVKAISVSGTATVKVGLEIAP